MAFICVKCGKSMSSKQALATHNKRKNKCDAFCECANCKKKFATQKQLDKHCNKKIPCINDHNVILQEFEKNQCSFCSKKYKSVSSFNAHLKTCKKRLFQETSKNISKDSQAETNKVIAQFKLYHEQVSEQMKQMESVVQLQNRKTTIAFDKSRSAEISVSCFKAVYK